MSVQEPKQSVPAPLQAKGAQGWVAPATHPPAPLQVETRLRVPAAQDAFRQIVPDA